MVKKGFLLVFSLLFSSILTISLVSANFACGTVVNKDNSSIISPAWFNIKVYYSEKPLISTFCKVSPENNRYCCNPREIQNVSWAPGKIVNAEINQPGYTAEKVNMKITGAGYDVFPDLKIERALEIVEPNNSVYFNITSLEVFSKSASKFNSLSYSLVGPNGYIEQKEICSSCNQAYFDMENLSSGKYNLNITASNAFESYSENFTFVLLDYINFKRIMECDGCKGLRVPSGVSLVNFTLIVNSSHDVSGVLRDAFPNDWLYQGDLKNGELTESHNFIEWEFKGNSTVVKYSLVPPKTLFNYKYSFQTSLESVYSELSVISLSKFWFLDFIGLKKNYVKTVNSANIIKNVVVSQENPIILYPKNLEVSEVAIFPKKTQSNVLSFVKNYPDLSTKDSISTFMIWSSLNREDVSNVLMKFSVNKNLLKKNKNVSLEYYDSSSSNWTEIPIYVIGEDDLKFNYLVNSTELGGYSIIVK